MGTPLVCLSGAADPDRTGPIGDPHDLIVIRRDLGCVPCRARRECKRGDIACMTGMEVDWVFEAVGRRLGLVRPLPQAEAEALAQRLLCALADTPVMHEGRAVPVSASIGFGLFPLRTSDPDAELEVSWERAVSLADTAMYMAKAHGRNGACSILRVDAASQDDLEQIIQQLEKSVGDGRVELRFQHGPVVRGALTTIARAPGPACAPEAA